MPKRPVATKESSLQGKIRVIFRSTRSKKPCVFPRELKIRMVVNHCRRSRWPLQST